ncbi:thiamine phosphate synthase [uncultured Helicobacter sp.]|uniref:thiamine phosphate synthase n=1 Tax=uncultured Helicobacter sp. TaxID=175537 RepID=UPI001C3B83FF|nr:thiamine phosphate synthase [Candidatus Helicobacter avicola]
MKSYLITPEVTSSYFESLPLIFHSFRPDYAMYRSSNRAFAREFAALCHTHNIVCFLNSQGFGDEMLDSLLPYFDGVHLKSSAFSLISSFSVHCAVGFSAHTPQEVREALCNGANYAMLSPIFSTPHKGTPIGIESLRALDSQTRARTFGLGGIDTPQKVAQLAQIENLYGFASIRYFLGGA